jgi:ABC-type transport system involved in cytochrome bd biosynthesis fused ATPase/permease subunit
MSVLRLASYPLRRPFGWMAVGFLAGGLILIGTTLGIALADQSVWMRNLSLSIVVAMVFLLAILLFLRVRLSRFASQLCPDCAALVAANWSRHPEELRPHKVAAKKSKRV